MKRIGDIAFRARKYAQLTHLKIFSRAIGHVRLPNLMPILARHRTHQKAAEFPKSLLPEVAAILLEEAYSRFDRSATIAEKAQDSFLE
jgi:hypothetical protein